MWKGKGVARIPSVIPHELENVARCPKYTNARRIRRRTISTGRPSERPWTATLAAINPLANFPFAPGSSTSNVVPSSVDPLKLLGKEMGSLRDNVKSLLGSGHPALDTIAKYYFQAEGKHVRPMIVLLMSQATNGLSPAYKARQEDAIKRERYFEVDNPLEPTEVLTDDNPDLLARAKSFLSTPFGSSRQQSATSSLVLPTQRRLAEITEMIHVASLLHDDVIDLASTRRSAPSAPNLFGNKLSILAGDFLLARASLALSRLGSNEVVELVASVLANLVEGEVMQMKGNTPESAPAAPTKLTREVFDHYMRKTYLKTASLIAKSARASTILGGCGERQGWKAGERIKDVAYAYGKNLGIAFQLIDDMLDFTASAAQLGKPGQGADLKLGLATAPALYAWQEFPQLGAMIERKFEAPGDVEQARELIMKSSGAERTAALAAEHSRAAIEALQELPESDSRTALEQLARDTLNRKK